MGKTTRGHISFPEMSMAMLSWGKAYTEEEDDFAKTQMNRTELIESAASDLTSDGMVLLGILAHQTRTYRNEKFKKMWLMSREEKHGPAPHEVLYWLEERMVYVTHFNDWTLPEKWMKVREAYDKWMKRRKPKQTKGSK